MIPQIKTKSWLPPKDNRKSEDASVFFRLKFVLGDPPREGWRCEFTLAVERDAEGGL